MIRNFVLGPLQCIALSSIFIASSYSTHSQANDVALQAQIDELKAQIELLQQQLDEPEENPFAEISGYVDLQFNDEGTEGSGPQISNRRFFVGIDKDYNEQVSFHASISMLPYRTDDVANAQLMIEEAYLKLHANDGGYTQVGAFYIPIGAVSNRYDPTQFFGVKVNPVERYVLPNFWSEAGVLRHLKLGEYNVDLAYHTSLKLNSDTIASGRQFFIQADASSMAYSLNVSREVDKYLTVSAAVQYQQDVTMQADDVSGVLTEVHFDYQAGPFGIRGLFAEWNFSNSPTYRSLGDDQQVGYYFEPSFRLNQRWGLFSRLSTYDLQAGDSMMTEMTQFDVGFNHWVADFAVLKAEYTLKRDELDISTEGYHLGLSVNF